jgi:hypothetical protein
LNVDVVSCFNKQISPAQARLQVIIRKDSYMSKADYLGSLPEEARNFKAPPDAKAGTPVGNPGAEPTDEQLAPYRNMSQADWDAKVAGWKQADADWQNRGKEQQERRDEIFRRKTQALETLKVTGDPIADAASLFAAAEVDIDQTDPATGTALKRGDRDGVLQYFSDIQNNEAHLPVSQSADARRYWTTFFETVRKILSVAEAVSPDQRRQPSS